ncbi:46 kDa FK506-binding nuclear protein [Euwallacea fornicatus]|uniref:46 kDa FK506-binding nuclear protein n=1 Tax=Euwallacea fornicatus TaxID=995702 RepID=UPI00338FBC64
MFWGLIMEPDRRYSQKVKKSFHISMASLDINSSSEEPSQLMCSYDGRNYLLCTLRKPDLLQCSLDLEFAAGTEVSFAANGKAHVHLTGYLSETDNDELTLNQLAEEVEDEESEDDAFEEVFSKKAKRQNNDKESVPAKKTKLLNGSAKVELAEDEDDSDDPDFDEEMANGEEVEEEEDDGNESDTEDEDEDEESETEAPQVTTTKQKPKKESEAKQGTSEKKQKQTLKGGVIVEDLVEGNGPPAKAGRFVTVYYEGRLQKNNKLFDSTSKGPGFKFRLGGGEVIKGWDVGLVGMKVGGKRKIVCPPQAGYGAKGSPPAIPPNSTLVFTVTLKKIK